MQSNKPPNIITEYILDEGNSLTADILRALENKITSPFVGLAGDVIVGSSTVYSRGYEQVLKEGSFASVALSPKVNEIGTHGVAKITDDRVTEFLFPPPKTLEKDHLRDMMIWGLSNNFYAFARLYPNISTASRLLHLAIQDKEYVIGNLYEDSWIHFGSPIDLRKSLK